MWTWAEWIADHIVALTPWTTASAPGAALQFFIYDLLKIVVLIAAISFVMRLVRQALPMAVLQRWLQTPHGRLFGYPTAAMFGALTPFCSCSSVPIFLGFVQAQFPIGVAFAFLITSPLVNEIAFVLLGVAFGWKLAAAYAVAGIALGIGGGLVLSAGHAERWLQPSAAGLPDDDDEPAPHGWRARIADGIGASGHILRSIGPWLVAALAFGAALHGFVPDGLFQRWFAGTGAWSVPLASLIGLPLYVSANATVPLLEAFVHKGVPLGTALAFLLSAVGVSFPELVMLRSVMTTRLLAAFSLVVLVGTTLIGWLFNAWY